MKGKRTKGRLSFNPFLRVPKEHNSRERDLLQMYFSEVGKFRLLTSREERNLAILVREKNDQEALNKLVCHNLRLVVKVANCYFGLDMMDLIQEGNIGLMIAAKRFDHRKGCRFSTFAIFWINSTINRAIQVKKSLIRVPVHVQLDVSKLFAVAERIAMKNGYLPVPEELAKALGWSAEKVQKLLKAYQIGNPSLFSELNQERKGRKYFFDSTVQEEKIPNPEMCVAAEEEMKRLCLALGSALNSFLPRCKNSKRDANIFIMRYGLDDDFQIKTLEEIGKKYGLTRERIRQIIKKFCSSIKLDGRKTSRKELEGIIQSIKELDSLTAIRVGQCLKNFDFLEPARSGKNSVFSDKAGFKSRAN